MLPDVGTDWYQLREGEFVTILPAQWTLDAVLDAETTEYSQGGVASLMDMRERADVDGDGSITGTDASMLGAFLYGREDFCTFTDLHLLKMDVDLNKVVDTDDLIIIMEYIVGLR